MENQTQAELLEELRTLLKRNNWLCDGADENGFEFYKEDSEFLFSLDAK
jgi:hypothetical protein